MTIYIQGKAVKKVELVKILDDSNEDLGFQVVHGENSPTFSLNHKSGYFNVLEDEASAWVDRPIVRVMKSEKQSDLEIGYWSGERVYVDVTKRTGNLGFPILGQIKLAQEFEEAIIINTADSDIYNGPGNGAYWSGEKGMKITNSTPPHIREKIILQEQARKMGFKPQSRLDCFMGDYLLGDNPENEDEKSILTNLAKSFLKYRYAFNQDLVIFNRTAIQTRNEAGKLVLEEVVLEE